jgi:hypothetical protein
MRYLEAALLIREICHMCLIRDFEPGGAGIWVDRRDSMPRQLGCPKRRHLHRAAPKHQ